MNIYNPIYKNPLDYKTNTWIPFYIGIILIVTIILYLYFPSGYNQGLYHYQGFVLKNGGLPYTGFIEKKGPMGLLTYSLASILFGESIMAYRIFDLIISSITGFFLFRLARLNYSKLINFLICVLWLQQILIDGPGNTGDVTNIITGCYVALAYYISVFKVKNRYFIIGVLIALACWVKPTALLIALPLLYLLINKGDFRLIKLDKNHLLKFTLGLFIPTLVFSLYLLISNTFYAFWESVILDTIFNYTGHVSRFSLRVISKTIWTFLNDPIFRFGGLLSLFLISKNNIIKLIAIGIGLMVFIEGRLYPYHFSILWPFLALNLVGGFSQLIQKFSNKSQKALITLFLVLTSFPAFSVGGRFIHAGFLTKDFDAGQTFIFPDFKDMYDLRKLVVSSLENRINTQEELLVLGHDPNIYLELGVITTCRLARDGNILIGEITKDTPSHVISWQEELIQYMDKAKPDWIVVKKELTNSWIQSYREKINTIFSKKYKLEHSTKGHYIYKKQ